MYVKGPEPEVPVAPNIKRIMALAEAPLQDPRQIFLEHSERVQPSPTNPCLKIGSTLLIYISWLGFYGKYFGY